MKSSTASSNCCRNCEAQIPAAVQINTLYDRSVSIRASVNDVKFTLMLTIGLVVMVIFLFLRNISATIIPGLALPMSIIGTFSVMYLLGYSLDNLSLMALTLSVGFVVDDAIVMLENIVRHMEMGKSPLAARPSMARGEIGFTILSMTLSLAAVFIPLLFMGGIIGRLLHEFAVVIGVAILVSGFVSLTLTPMLCSRFLKHSEKEKHGRFYNASRKGFRCLAEGLRLVAASESCATASSRCWSRLRSSVLLTISSRNRKLASFPTKIRVSSSLSLKRSRASLSAT